MKILQVTAIDYTVEKFMRPLIDKLQAEGHEVHTACRAGEAAQTLLRDGYRIHSIPFHRNLNMLGHLANVFRLYRLLRRHRFDIVHTHTPIASIVARLSAKLARVPTVIYTAHGFYFHENMNPLVYKFIYGLEKVWGKRLTDFIFFQSREDYELAVSKKFNKYDHLVHIGNGVSAEKFDPSLHDRRKKRHELGFDDDDTVLMFVGRIVREKGILELLEAYDSLKRQGRERLKLVLVGGSIEGDRDGLSLGHAMANLPAELRKDLHVLGLRNDIPSLLSACDVFILPSYREGLPRSIIEAMAMGKPIIATDIRGCREEVFPDQNGYLCERMNSEDLAQKIALLIDDPNKISKFGERSRELFLHEFNENRVLDRQIQVFKRIARNGSYV